jgi:hypothetical protein
MKNKKVKQVCLEVSSGRGKMKDRVKEVGVWLM